MFNDKMKGLMRIHEHPGAMSTENKNIRRIFVKKITLLSDKNWIRVAIHKCKQANVSTRFPIANKDSCTATDSAVEGSLL